MSSDTLATDRPNQCSFSSLYDKKTSEVSKRSYSHSCKSGESLNSVSGTFRSAALNMYKRKPPKTVATHIAPNNEVRQRVLSARMHRIRGYQNQLNDAQLHISELTNENRILRTLHKRQDSALAKYENSNAELPQLLHSHTEEIRMWQARVRTLQAQNKDLMQKLKQKDASMQVLLDQNKHFQQLNNNRNLEERDKLSDRVSLLDLRLQEKDDEMKLISRRLQVESKQLKSQLCAEQAKYKELQQKHEELVKTTGAMWTPTSKTFLPVAKSTSSVRPSKMSSSKPQAKERPKVAVPPEVPTRPERPEVAPPVENVSHMKIPPKAVKLNNDTLVNLIRSGMGDIAIRDETALPPPSGRLLNKVEEEHEQSESLFEAEENVIDVGASDSELDTNWEDDDEEEDDEDENDENEEGENEEDDDEDENEEDDEDDTDLDDKKPPTTGSSETKFRNGHTKIGNESDIEQLLRSHRADIGHRATLLDSMCDGLVSETQTNVGNGSGDGPNIKSTLLNKRSNTPAHKSSIPRHIIDPHKKSQLLQALRSIDSK